MILWFTIMGQEGKLFLSMQKFQQMEISAKFMI